MDELHSIACSNNNRLQSSVWDFHDIEVFNADISQFLENTPPLVSSFESDYSTGYLQDALCKFNSKRRRLLLFDDNNLEDPTKECSENYDNLSQRMSISSCDTMSGESMCASMTTLMEDSYPFMGGRTLEEAFSVPPEMLIEYSSSSSYQKDSICNHSMSDNKELVPCMDPFLSSGSGHERRKKRMSTQIAYPFAVIKPGGSEGDVTLNEINEKILMPPTRPVRHPVGDFACRPLVASPDGPGLSGKAVVALRKIQTQGRGTITIIRTRG